MRFSERVIKFEFAGIPLVGNVSTGRSIGLSPEGETLCGRLFDEDLSEDELRKTDNSLTTQLIDGGFFDEFEDAVSLHSAFLHVTQKCNLNCLGCCSYTESRNTAEDPSLSMILSAVKELASWGVRKLCISGGEPFLRKDLGEVVSYAKTQCGIKQIIVITNGTILDADLFRRIRPYVDTVSVSIDGTSDSCPTYTRGEQRYSQLIEVIEAIASLDIPVSLLPTIHGKNICDIEEYQKLANNLGASLTLSLLKIPASAEDMHELLPNETDLEKIGKKIFELARKGALPIQEEPFSMDLSVKTTCGAAKEKISIAADGSVFPCHLLHDEAFLFGNIFLEPLATILSRKSVAMFKENMVQPSTKCQSCEYLWFCSGGCKARSYAFSGELSSCDPYCQMFKSFYGSIEKKLEKKGYP